MRIKYICHVLGKTGHDIMLHQTFWLQDLKKSTFSLLFENIKMSHQLICTSKFGHNVKDLNINSV